MPGRLGRPPRRVVMTFPSRLFNARQIDQAVCLIRRRGSAKDVALLTDAGYAPYRKRR